MIEQTTNRSSFIEIVYISFISVLYFVRGIGGYEGQPLFNAALVLAFLMFALKILMTRHIVAEYIGIALLMFLGGIIYYQTGEKWFLLNMTMLLGIKDVRIKKVLDVVWWILTTTFVIGFVLCITGLITPECMLHPKNGIGYIICYGMIYPHPNSLHSMFLLITALIIYKVGECSGKKLVYETILLVLANIYVFIYTFSYTGFGSTMLLILINAYFQTRKALNKADYALIEMIFPICIVFSIVGPVTITGKAFDIINKVLSTRYNLSRYFLTQQPITLLGARLEVPNYTYNIDCSYVYLFIQMGIVAFVLGVIGYIILIHYLHRNDFRIELAITLAFCIAGVAEPLLFNSSFKNITLMFMGIVMYRLIQKSALPKALSKEIIVFNPEKIKFIDNILAHLENVEHAKAIKGQSDKKHRNTSCKIDKKRVLVLSVIIGALLSIVYIGLTDNLKGIYVSEEINQTTSDAPVEYMSLEKVLELENDGYEVVGYISDADPLYGYFGVTGTIEYLRRVISIFVWSMAGVLSILYLIQIYIRYKDNYRIQTKR